MKKALLPLLFLICADAPAQMHLNITKLQSATWLQIEITFTITCNGSPAIVSDKALLRLEEDGVEITDYTLYYPPPTQRLPRSTAIVLDASANMSSTSNSKAKDAANMFVDFLDTTRDSSAVFWFQQHDSLLQNFTRESALVHAAINPLPASGNAALWDGVYAGLTALAAKQSLSARLLVFSNGVDNASTHTLAQCIALANQARIRVYSIGYGANVQMAVLKELADYTGGRYYFEPNPAQLSAVLDEITTLIWTGNFESTITYTASCRDGSTRLVKLANPGSCLPEFPDSAFYTAPRDTASLLPIRIALPTQSARGRDSATVLLSLLDALAPGDILHQAEWELRFDTSKAHFTRIEAIPGMLLAGIPVTVTPIAGGLRFRTAQRKRIDSSLLAGPLAALHFTAADPQGMDTVLCPLTLASWNFDRGCFTATPESGVLAIAPRRPELSCRMDAPDSVQWLRDHRVYSPDPMRVSITLRNAGDREARNARCSVIYNKSDLSLVGAQRDTVWLAPTDIAIGMEGSALWDFTLARRSSGGLVHVCVEAMFDNAPSMQCCRDVWVPPAGPILAPSASAPLITVDRAAMRYAPMPFALTVSVKNIGGQPTDSVRASIAVPPDLELAGVDQGRVTKALLPGVLAPAQQGSVSWLVKHQPTPVEKEYRIGIWVKSANADSAYCEAMVLIPPLEGPALAPQCTVPDSLHFDEALDAYRPNPFTVRLSCVNRGGLPAMNVGGILILPPDVLLSDPGDSLRREIGALMNPWKSGDPVPQRSWNVIYTKKRRNPSDLLFRFAVAGKGPSGLPTDTVETSCHVPVPGLPPFFACELSLPDSIRADSTQSALLPNPIPVIYRIHNVARQLGTVSRVEIRWENSDGLLADAATPALRVVNRSLSPGDTLPFTWLLHAEARTSPRRAYICVRAWDDEENLIECCDSLPIAKIERALGCNVSASSTRIVFDSVHGGYSNDRWTVTATLSNTGSTALSAVSAAVSLADSSMARYVEFDPAFADNSNPKGYPALFPQGSRQFQWGFRLKAENRTLHSVIPEFRIRATAAGVPIPASGCSVPIEIDAVPGPRLVARCTVPDTLRYDEAGGVYLPDSFAVTLECVNRGFRSAKNIIATLALPPRLMLATPGETLTKALAPTMLDRDTGGPAPQLAWRLRAAGFAKRDTCPGISVSLSGIDTASGNIIHAAAFCAVCIQGTEPRFDCSLDCIDSLRLNAKGDDVLPNPFPVRYRIANTGHVHGGLALADITLPSGQSLTLDVSTPATQPIAKSTAPGDTAIVTWLVRVANQLAPRKADIVAVAYDSSGTPMSCVCSTVIPAVSIINAISAAPAPDAFVLHQNTPNPFSTTTALSYGIPYAMHVQLRVTDALGREVALLVDGEKGGGMHNAVFDAGTLPNGMYLCTVDAGGRRLVRLLSLVK